MNCEYLERTSDKPCLHYISEGFCSLPDRFRCLEWMKTYDVTVSYSAMKDAAQCWRKYYHAYIQGLELKDKPIRMLLGTIVGRCLALIHTETADIHNVIDTTIDVYQTTEEPLKELEAVRGLMHQYSDEFSSGKGIPEYEFLTGNKDSLDGPRIHGFIDLADRMLPDENGKQLPYHFYEFKYTGNPSNYSKFVMTPQLSCYFLGVPTAQSATVRLIQVPELRLAKGETVQEYGERVAKDYKQRPKHYVTDQTYWREEFDLNQILEKARMIVRDIARFSKVGTLEAFYQNQQGCFSPFRCEFLDICETGVVSETLYTKREVQHDTERTENK